MLRRVRSVLLIIVCCACVGCSMIPSQNTKKVCFKGECVSVEVVSSQGDMARGLQHRTHLDEDKGMLFLFNSDQRHRFWMKDTKISLDIVWINSYREVVNMALFVPPCKTDPCPTYQPNEAAKYVLEINAGKVEKMGFKPGDRLQFR
jgi:uncharacterized membrane protein (UPF0127 family)